MPAPGEWQRRIGAGGSSFAEIQRAVARSSAVSDEVLKWVALVLGVGLWLAFVAGMFLYD